MQFELSYMEQLSLEMFSVRAGVHVQKFLHACKNSDKAHYTFCLHDLFCLVDGNWGKWGSWNDCTKSCGGGKQTKKRECTNPKPAYGGKACDNESDESRACNTRECPGNSFE